MSIGLGKGVGIPVKLMHESEGHVITVSTIYILSFCSGSFSRKEGSFWIFSRCHFCSSSSTCSCSLVMKDAKEREEERRQRTRRVFLMLGMLFSSSSSSSERVFLRGCGPYKIAHWQTFFFLLLLLIRLNWNPANCTEGRWWKPRTTGTVSWRTCRTRRETVRVFTFVSFFIRRKVVRALAFVSSRAKAHWIDRAYAREAAFWVLLFSSHSSFPCVLIAFLFPFLVLATLVSIVINISLTRACFLYYE